MSSQPNSAPREKKNRSLRALLFQYMFAVIIISAVIRIGLWIAYQLYEVKLGAVVFHEQLTELLLLLLVEVIALGVLGFMLWQVSRKLMSPLRSVANAAKLISQGQLDKRIRTRHLPKGELLEIADTLNASFDQYQEAIDRISRFSSAASHQLRTPLAAIQNTAELSLAKEDTPEAREQALLSILEEADHLTRMTEQLLLLSRMEADHLRRDFTEIDVNRVIQHVVDVFQPMTESHALQVNADYAPACTVVGEETLLMEAVMNLFDNAVKVSKSESAITIRTREEEGSAIVEIEDCGPGVDEEFRSQMFERFHRASTTAYKGTGLGLSIVSEVVKLHGGRVEVVPGTSAGSCFRLIFPRAS